MGDDLNEMPRRRAVTSVDLTDLRDAVIERSEGRVSAWIRELIRKELGKSVESRRGAGVYRAWLDADLTAKLDDYCRVHGFVTRAAALRAAIEGVGNGRVAGGKSDSGSLRDAVDALGTSNFQLVAIGRNLNQIAKAQHATTDVGAAGRERLTDALALERAHAAVLEHLESAADVVALIRPMLRQAKDAKRPTEGPLP